jgi:hypothetical protein
MAMLTESERRFMDRYLREGFLHDYEGPAHQASWAKGIVYDDYVRLYPFYQEAWRLLGDWPDHLPPLPDDANMACPWGSREQLQARIAELESLVDRR